MPLAYQCLSLYMNHSVSVQRSNLTLTRLDPEVMKTQRISDTHSSEGL